MKYKLLSIAGFDGSGGAGIQADLKTFSAFGCYGMSVLTALPIQNTQGVKKCYELPLSCIQEQLEAIFEDIFPSAIKIGMLFTGDIIEIVSNFLKRHAAKTQIILDPVMRAKSGDSLLVESAVSSLKKNLLPLASVITPNVPEAEALTGHRVNQREDVIEMAHRLLSMGPQAVLIKGGHLKTPFSEDLLLTKDGLLKWYEAPRILTQNTHGTGCTLSAALAACLGQGLSLEDSCEIAKRYVTEAIKSAQDMQIGQGQGPLHHFYHLWPSLQKI